MKDIIMFHLVSRRGYAPWQIEGVGRERTVNFGLFFDRETAQIVKEALDEKLKRER